MNGLTYVLLIVSFLTYIFALDLTEHESHHSDSVFFDFNNDEEFLELIQLAESQLKIYIYPVPKDAFISDTERDMMGHFRIENMYPHYLMNLHSHVPINDSRRNMIVDSPDKANAFIIDNAYMRLTRVVKCDLITNKHMKHIIENVVDHQPYFNRSNGDDHFFMAVYDKSYCAINCEADAYERDKSMKSCSHYRLLRAHAIGNYGMDMKTFEKDDPEKVYPCHRSGYDIVVPQLFQEEDSREFFMKYHKSRIPTREFDSTFSGAAWGERKPLETMVIDPDKDYQNGCERFIALTTDPKYKLNGNPEMSLIYRGYFMYDPCKYSSLAAVVLELYGFANIGGYACWSRRKYEALMHYTIPIIVTSGAIQAFEKFFDWTKFSVKMLKETWFDDKLRDDYRKKLRLVSDEYRHALHECWKSIGMDPPLYMNNSNRPPKYDDSWVNIGLKDRSSKCGKVFDTVVWKKTSAMQKALKWFDFSNYKTTRKNAFRVLTLELWCRIKSIVKSEKHTKICNRASDYTARLEFVQ